MSSNNEFKTAAISSLTSSYKDNYYSLYLKLKDFTNTSLPNKLLDEVQTIKKAVIDIESFIENNYDGNCVQISLDNLNSLKKGLEEKETFISDKLIPSFKLIPKLRKLLIKKYTVSAVRNNNSITDYIDVSDSYEEDSLISLAESIDSLSDSLGFGEGEYISETATASLYSTFDKEIESVIKRIRKLLRDDLRIVSVPRDEGEMEGYYEGEGSALEVSPVDKKDQVKKIPKIKAEMEGYYEGEGSALEVSPVDKKDQIKKVPKIKAEMEGYYEGEGSALEVSPVDKKDQVKKVPKIKAEMEGYYEGEGSALEVSPVDKKDQVKKIPKIKAEMEGYYEGEGSALEVSPVDKKDQVKKIPKIKGEMEGYYEGEGSALEVSPVDKKNQIKKVPKEKGSYIDVSSGKGKNDKRKQQKKTTEKEGYYVKN